MAAGGERLQGLLDGAAAVESGTTCQASTSSKHLAARRAIVAALDELEAAVHSDGLLGAAVGGKAAADAAALDVECRLLSDKLRPQSGGAALAIEQLRRV